MWKAPEGMPIRGRVTTLPVPGTISGFSARDAQVYLPPSYFTNPRPLLPVLVLMAGQPGKPEDWLQGGKLTRDNGCLCTRSRGVGSSRRDSRWNRVAGWPIRCAPTRHRARSARIWQRTCPLRLANAFQIDTNPRAWAIGGLSYGGTCSLQMATNYPEVYPTFLDLSGQLEPSLGDRQRTVDEIFGGDEAAFVKVNPMDLLATRKFPNSGGVFVVGTDDNEFKPGSAKGVRSGQRRTGMDARYLVASRWSQLFGVVGRRRAGADVDLAANVD